LAVITPSHHILPVSDAIFNFFVFMMTSIVMGIEPHESLLKSPCPMSYQMICEGLSGRRWQGRQTETDGKYDKTEQQDNGGMDGGERKGWK
jgi:hypothetical protein